MSVQIRISYEHPEEKRYILKKLGMEAERVREPAPDGKKYRRLYIDLKKLPQ